MAPRRSASRCTLALFAMLAFAGPAAAKTFTACMEASDGPPLLYYAEPAPGQAPRLTGFNAEVWPLVLAQLGHTLAVRGDLPFKRCLRAVSIGEVDFALGVYRDEERARTLAFSAPFKTLTPQVFFRADKPLKIQSMADLKRWRGCGMNGSSYAHYGLQPGDLDQGARSFRTLFEKLMTGRCDYVVEELEVVQQLEINKRDYLATPGLAHAPVPGAVAPARHIVARLGSEAAALLPAMDDAYARLVRQGEVQKIWRRHAASAPF